MGRICIVIPTYNEAENLPKLVKMLAKILRDDDFEIIIVDDNSPNGTGQVADEIARICINVKIIHRPRKGGLSSAIIDGLRVAEGEHIAVMDADLQHPPELLKEMLEKSLGGADLVIASRYTDGGGLEDWSPWRKIVSKGATLLAHMFSPRTRKVRDPLSGYFLFRKKILNGVRLNPLGYKLLLEILVKGKYERIVEVPYVFRPRMKGKSKLKPLEYVNYLLHLSRLMKFNICKSS